MEKRQRRSTRIKSEAGGVSHLLMYLITAMDRIGIGGGKSPVDSEGSLIGVTNMPRMDLLMLHGSGDIDTCHRIATAANGEFAEEETRLWYRCHAQL